jgi:hypothetical protein
MDRKEHRYLRPKFVPGLDDALRHHVGARKGAAEIDYQAFHAGIGQHEIERNFGFGVSLSADFKKICGTTSKMADHIHSGHCQARAVREHADIAVELDQLEAMLGTAFLKRSHDPSRTAFRDLGLPVRRRVVEHKFAVERYHATISQQRQWIDFE